MAYTKQIEDVWTLLGPGGLPISVNLLQETAYNTGWEYGALRLPPPNSWVQGELTDTRTPYLPFFLEGFRDGEGARKVAWKRGPAKARPPVDLESERFRRLRNCFGCGEVSNEDYSVLDKVWGEAAPSEKGVLHLACLEKRLGRPLQPEDFKRDLPINQPLAHLMRRNGGPRRDQEHILCASIWVDTGKAEPRRMSYAYPETGIVFCGWRHGDCFLGLIAWSDLLDETERNRLGEEMLSGRHQGFLTSKGRHVDRQEAAKIAQGQGQCRLGLRYLTSEDLY